MEYGELRAELQRIRDWRHDFANDMARWQESVDNSLREMKKDVTAVSTTVAALSSVAESNHAVAAALAKRGAVIPVGWITKSVALAVSLSAIGSFILLAFR